MVQVSRRPTSAGVTVVRLDRRSLVKEAQIRELACDLLDLIEAGNHRVVLNFQVVERLASWVVIAVDEARRLCESADGGALKICGLPTATGLGFPDRRRRPGQSALMPTRRAAIDSPWPETSRARGRCPSRFCRRSPRAADIPPLARRVRLRRPAEIPARPGAGRIP